MANLAKIRSRLLSARGVEYKPKPRPKKAPKKDKAKTWAMIALETQTGKPIQELLLSCSLSQFEKRYHVDHSTASKWIKRLSLRWHEGNLPSCTGCSRKDLTCQATRICHLLLDQSSCYNVIFAKARQMLAAEEASAGKAGYRIIFEE